MTLLASSVVGWPHAARAQAERTRRIGMLMGYPMGARPGSLLARMTTRLKRAGHRSRYRLRKQVVEPVFRQIKEARGFRQFLLRGIEKVSAEWAMICIAHNLRKLALAAA
jgi:hypothetical protein